VRDLGQWAVLAENRWHTFRAEIGTRLVEAKPFTVEQCAALGVTCPKGFRTDGDSGTQVGRHTCRGNLPKLNLGLNFSVPFSELIDR